MCMTELAANYTLIYGYETTLFRMEKDDENRCFKEDMYPTICWSRNWPYLCY